MIIDLTRAPARGQVIQRDRPFGVSRLTLEGQSSEKRVLARLLQGQNIVSPWRHATVSAGGTFQLQLRRVPTGGPYRIELKAGKSKILGPSFWIGDVWVLAGQSNMQGIGDMQWAPPTHAMVRSLRMNGVWQRAKEPLHILRESTFAVHHCGGQFSPAKSRAFSKSTEKGVGPGLAFGRAMQHATHVPQGLLPCAHGGTSMREWAPDREGDSLYRAMIETVRRAGGHVAGVLWYQGESDAASPASISPKTENNGINPE